MHRPDTGQLVPRACFINAGRPCNDASMPRRDASVFIGGPEKVDVVIVAYDPAWPRRFEIEREKIVGALAGRALAIDHVGSTSVPGLAAKPIVDICLTVADSSVESSYLGDLQAVGYELRVREPDFHEHRMLRSSAHDVHVHVFTHGSEEITRYRVFRDWLRQNAADRELYASTKRQLSNHDWPTMQDYADAKTDVVDTILGHALGRPPPG
jgi:GrpB-like predicted nucleotidyltransferase (UPF0157 family)